MKKILSSIILVSLLTVFSIRVQAAAKVSLSASKTTIEQGESVKITISNDSSGKYSLAGTLTLSGATTGTLHVAFNAAGSDSITVKPEKTGTITAKFVGEAALNEPPFTREKVEIDSLKITVKEKPKTPPNNTGTGTGLGPGDYNPALPKGESEKEKAARLLEERKKTPLIEELKIFSESDRLKGEVVGLVETEFNEFKYKYTLPRNVDTFKLEAIPIADDVVLTYDKLYKLEEGYDKVEINIKATQDVITQEFVLTITKPVINDFDIAIHGVNHKVMNDEYLDSILEPFGFVRTLLNKEVETGKFYYEKDGQFLVLAYDEDNNAKWALVDSRLNFKQEVILVAHKDKALHMLVSLEDVDERTYKGAKYQSQFIDVSKQILEYDKNLVFKDSIYGWKFEENSLITHALIDEEIQLVHLDSDHKLTVAYVAFDEKDDVLLEYWGPAATGIWGLSLVIFLVYATNQNKKIKMLLNRRE